MQHLNKAGVEDKEETRADRDGGRRLYRGSVLSKTTSALIECADKGTVTTESGIVY